MNWFEPSRDHARTCREAMDRALWDSVPELLDEHGVAAADAIDQDISGPTDFLDYAAYFDLAIPLPEGAVLPESERAFALRRLARRLPVAANLEARPAMPRITRFVPAAYAPEELAQMARWWDHEPANRMAMTDPSDEEFATVGAAISEAMQYLAMASSELHGEVELLVRDIVLTRPDGVNNRINYSGASSFALWGALTINAETQREWLQVYRQIVHETAHNLLFAIARDGPLIAADPAERRASPLREVFDMWPYVSSTRLRVGARRFRSTCCSSAGRARALP
ncbi:MAG: HEXXH motif-containing putative peptide modification protein [Sphingomonadaceae bacterium]